MVSMELLLEAAARCGGIGQRRWLPTRPDSVAHFVLGVGMVREYETRRWLAVNDPGPVPV